MENNRIYTSPAREVVAGMIWGTGSDIVQAPLCDGSWVTIEIPGHGPSDFPADMPLIIRLPGPSPRDTEANGGLCRCLAIIGPPALAPDQLWQEHEDDCPVYRLRLRLWPVGATWNTEDAFPGDPGGCYAVPLPGHDVPQNIHPCMLLEMLGDGPIGYRGADVRAAFCEPVGTP